MASSGKSSRYRRLLGRLALAFAFAGGFKAGAEPGEWSGALGAELRVFTQDPAFRGQHDNLNLSLMGEIEYFKEWEERNELFHFLAFGRLDQNDGDRSHADIRELTWEKAWDEWDLRLGIRKVYWGVTESIHLVDTINQTDLVENLDGEDKLGQPMVNVAYIQDWGTIDLFMLPGFRERTFPGESGRLRAPLPVSDDAEYESGAEELHIDWAARYAHTIGDWDFGVSHFWGTSRDPRILLPNLLRGERQLTPLYDIIHQTGLDVQFTRGGWLLKFEGIHRSGQDETFNAFAAGFEYTFFDIAGSGIDLGLLSEYLYDDRGDHPSAPFQDDIFAGFRLGFNDIKSTHVLAGAIFDRDNGATFLNLEASRRIRQNWTIAVEARAFMDIPDGDPLSPVQRDDYFSVLLTRYF